MNNINSTETEFYHEPRPQLKGQSCGSCLFSLYCSLNFLSLGLLFAVLLAYFKAPIEYALVAGGIFLIAFLWQRRAARRGCFMPVFIFAVCLVSEFVVFGMLLYQSGAYQKFDFARAKRVIEKYAPGLYDSGIKALQTATEQGQQLYKSGLDTMQSALENFSQSDEDIRLAALEQAFQANPGNPDAVLALADEYMARNDLASARLAIALYEALVETDPCDVFLERLADAYARVMRYDLAFTTAARRTWLPHANSGKAARQLAMFAVSSSNFARGIFELEKILQLAPPESEEIKLLLAGLFVDSGNLVQANLLVDQVIADAPSELAVARSAAVLKNQLRGN